MAIQVLACSTSLTVINQVSYKRYATRRRESVAEDHNFQFSHALHTLPNMKVYIYSVHVGFNKMVGYSILSLFLKGLDKFHLLVCRTPF